MRIIRDGARGLEGLTSVIGRAAIEPAAWQDMAVRLAAMFPGIRLQFWGTDVRHPVVSAQILHGYDDSLLPAYFARIRHINPWWSAGSNVPVGQTIAKRMLVPDTDLERSEFYNDWIRPQDDIIAGGGQHLFRGPDRSFYLGGSIPRAHRDRAEPEFLRTVHAVAPYIRQALQVNRELLSLRVELSASRAGIDTTDTALLLLDDRQRIIFANDAAVALLEAGRHIALSATGRVYLTAAPARDAAAFLSVLAKPGLNRLKSVAGTEERILRLIQLSPEDADRMATLPSDMSAPPKSILVLPAPRPAPTRVTPFAEYGLTLAEAEVVARLANGMTPVEIAADRQASVHTVRNQIKSALGKTGMRRQSDLAVLWARHAAQ